MAEAPKKNSLVRAAVEALAQGNHAEAVRCCKHALKQDRCNYDAFVVLGKSLFASKQFEQADISYRRAADINPIDTRAWQGLAELHEATGNYAKVVEACNSVIHAFQSKGDLTHLAEYARRLAKAYVVLQDPQNALEGWKIILEIKSVSEGLHLEALCGVVDSKAVLMESWIQENCKMYLSQDSALDPTSARQVTENKWASSQDSMEFENVLRDVLKQAPSSEKYEIMLLHLLVWRMRASSLRKGQECRQLCFQVLQLCLSMLSWHASSLATVLLLALCEEDTVDDIFNEMGMVELAQGRLKRLHIIGKKLAHEYPDEALVMPILAYFMHQSPSCSVRFWQSYGHLKAHTQVQLNALGEVFKTVSRFRNLYGLTLQCAELHLQLVSGDLFLKLGSHEEASQVFQNIIKVAEERQDSETRKVLALAKEVTLPA